MMHQRVNLGERVMVFIPDDQLKPVEFHRYSLSEMAECFTGPQLEAINKKGLTRATVLKGVWVDAIYASCEFARLAAQISAVAASGGAK